jgi:hypothetical protein
MRAILVTLLVMLFAGVHTANAFTGTQAQPAPAERSFMADASAATVMELSLPQHMTCCEQTGLQGLTAKVSKCSVDCASLLPGSFRISGTAEADLELLSQPELTALIPALFTQPPIRT